MKTIFIFLLLSLLRPDYSGVTVPENIAPLTFTVEGSTKVRATFEGAKTVKVTGRDIRMATGKWHKFLKSCEGTVKVALSAKIDGKWQSLEPFEFYVRSAADPYIAYRLIEPGYEVWGKMGIYQRDITGFRQSAIITNASTGENCMNCHSFANKQPSRMVMHMRGECGGTYVTDGAAIQKLNTKTPQTISALVYPQWHPNGRYIAFSVNTTNQFFHYSDPNRVEVFDSVSDVVVYDTETFEIVSCPELKGGAFETYPTFSPDGKTLYFCSAKYQTMPLMYKDVKYSLCSIGFDESTRSFHGPVDTLYNARNEGRSLSLPRVSPDGKYLLFTLQDYGNFGIWHKDADLYMLSLADGSISACDEANSSDVESYHSWSSDSRWVVFSSRRDDGLYTKLYLAYVNPDGTLAKPFLLPQRSSSYYFKLLKSYNIPEFVSGKVCVSKYRLARKARSKGTDIKFSER